MNIILGDEHLEKQNSLFDAAFSNSNDQKNKKSAGKEEKGRSSSRTTRNRKNENQPPAKVIL